MVARLGEVVWVVDLNRQSLDRVVPEIGAHRLEGMFAAAGWQTLTVKYGQVLTDLFARPRGDALRRRIDEMSNPEYQRLLRCTASELRTRLPGTGPNAPSLRVLIAELDDAHLGDALRNLGGHDLAALDAAFAAIDDDRPTVIFAYTVKGFGLATEGHPRNHSALLTATQMEELATRCAVDIDDRWARFPTGSAADALCTATAERLRRPAVPTAAQLDPPVDLGRTPTGFASTQAALGRALLDVARAAPSIGERIVTISPDVSSSTNLGGWVNKVGVWSHEAGTDWFADDAETVLRWRERPAGQHIQLGIAETNLAGALGEFGATWSRWGAPLLPIGVVYDPFVERALEPWSFGIYAGGQSILVGTPSGVTLAPEGGAHQSIKTASIGLEQPDCISYEPAFAVETEWTLLASLGRLGRPDGTAAYLRLSTRPVDQSLADVPTDTVARERRRSLVVAGGYAMRRAERPAVTLAGMGALMPEVLQAADHLAELGVGADVVCVTSADRLYRAVRARHGHGDGDPVVLEAILPAGRAAPMVTVLDGHPHTLAFLATVNRVPSINLGVTEFGQTGRIQDVYHEHGIDAESIVRAALDLTGAV